jgi:hypothetical protein
MCRDGHRIGRTIFVLHGLPTGFWGSSCLPYCANGGQRVLKRCWFLKFMHKLVGTLAGIPAHPPFPSPKRACPSRPEQE